MHVFPSKPIVYREILLGKWTGKIDIIAKTLNFMKWSSQGRKRNC
jgi:hypothetical protein